MGAHHALFGAGITITLLAVLGTIVGSAIAFALPKRSVFKSAPRLRISGPKRSWTASIAHDFAALGLRWPSSSEQIVAAFNALDERYATAEPLDERALMNRTLGHLNRLAGYSREARNSYDEALLLFEATQSQNLHDQAITLAMLADVDERAGPEGRDLATREYERAAQLFREAGEPERAEEASRLRGLVAQRARRSANRT